MKTTNYKVGDVVKLADGQRYKYLGAKPNEFGRLECRYEPLEPSKSGYFRVMEEDGISFAPFSDKISAEVEEAPLKWYEKIAAWWKASNRWKHFLFAIPLGAVCGMDFTAGVALGMEVKDHLYGNKADVVDFVLTALGGAIGHLVMRLVGLDYLIMFLIKLIS